MTNFKKSLLFVLFISIVLLGSVVQVSAQDAPDIPVPEGGNVSAVDQLPDEPLRLAYLGYENNPFWFPIRDGVRAATEYLANFNTTVDYIIMGEAETAENVVAAMETAILKRYDAIVVTSFNDGTEVIINKAVDRGIPVITIIGESSIPSKRLAFIGQAAVEAGRTAGKIIADFMDEDGKYGIITGAFSHVQHEQRRQGAEEVLEKFDTELVGVYEAHNRADETYNIAIDMMTAHPDLKSIYCTAGGPFGAAKAVEDMGKTGEVGVVAFDWIPENVEYVKSGEMIAALSQDPFGMGFDSLVRLYNNIVAGWEPENPNGFIPVEEGILTSDNVYEEFPEE